MGWLSGILSGYADRQHEITDEAAKADLANQKREGDIYNSLLEHKDPEVRQMAATGILQLGQTRKRKTGLSGWMGEMQNSPIYATLGKYMNTPHDYEEVETVPQLRTRSMTAIPTLPAGQSSSFPSLAQPADSPTEAGAAPMTAPQPMPQPPPAPPAGLLGGAPPSPSGVAPLPQRTGAPQDPEPPEALQGEAPPPPPWTGGPAAGAYAWQPGQAPLQSQGAPPEQMTETVTPAADQPLGTVQRMHTVNRLPGYPSAADIVANKEAAEIRGKITGFQETLRAQGDPDWQKNGVAAYMAQYGKQAGVQEGDAQQVYGDRAAQLGVAEGTWMQPLYDKTDGHLIRWIPAGAKSDRALNPGDIAARQLGKGYLRGADVPPEDQAAWLAMQNKIAGDSAAAKAGGTARGKYLEEQRRIDPQAVEYAAKGMAADANNAQIVLTGRSQAFKDAVLKMMASKGLTIERLDEATRSMAMMATDILPVMDIIAEDAKEVAKAGLMDPISGRWNDFLQGTWGSSASELGLDPRDPKTAERLGIAAKFRVEAKMLQQAVAKAHAGARGAGSPGLLAEMDTLLSASRMDLPNFLWSMSGFKVWMDQYRTHLPNWGKPGTEMEPDTPDTSYPEAPPLTTLAPRDHLQLMIQKYGADAAATAAAAGAGGAGTQRTLSPQYTTPSTYDPATNKDRSSTKMKVDAATGAVTR